MTTFIRRGLPSLALLFFLSACAPMIYTPTMTHATQPRIADDQFITADNQILPLRIWQPLSSPPKAVVLAVHGFNDYSNFFDDAATYLGQRGILSYAYDQRGFGRAPGRGLWSGEDVMVSDLIALQKVLKKRHPGIPFYLLGESMGGAVVMLAMASDTPPDVNGVILSAPAVWARKTMPWYQRAALWIGAHTLPWLTLTGENLNIWPSDNVEMLLALGRDPLIIKKTRIDAMYGLTNLMDKALASAPRLRTPALILYGAKDRIIPKKPTRIMLRTLPADRSAMRRIAVYENGYHMLMRDLQAETVWRDMAFWIDDKNLPLPSRAEKNPGPLLAKEIP